MSRNSWLLAGVALVSLVAVGAALVSQHHYDMRPCPWCILQRAIFCAIAIVALLGLVIRGRPARLTSIVLVVVLTLCGASAALWQHFVAASAASCDLTLAEKIISGMRLDEHWPEVFMATASCSDARVNLLGLPYEAWSLSLFALMGALAVRLLLPRHAPDLRS